jgi:hypothetical protein
MNSKKKKRTKVIITVVILILAVGCGLLGYLWKTTRDQAISLTTELNKNTKTVYVATKDIKAGEQLSKDNVAQQRIRTGLESSYYITADDIGKYALLPMTVGTPVQTTMVVDQPFDTDTRDYEIDVAHLMTKQEEYDTVDVRIIFPTGEDYLILPKKTITKLSTDGNTFHVQANEEEILRMSSAIIDAYLNQGAYIYLTKYVSDSQNEAQPTYLVSSQNIDLINSDPNVLTKAEQTLNLSARLSLESRQAGMTDEDKTKVESGWGNADSNKQTSNSKSDEQNQQSTTGTTGTVTEPTTGTISQ